MDPAGGGGEIADHEGEGLIAAGLALAETVDGGVVEGMAGEVEATEAADGADLALGEALEGEGERVTWSGGVELELGTALGAGDGLGVEAAVGGVVVFGLTGGAKGEWGEGGGGAIVRELADDRVAGAAVGAVEERVAEAAVGGVEEFVAAVGAEGEIGGKVGAVAVAGGAGGNAELRVTGEGQGENREVFDEGGGWEFGFEAVAEGGEGGQRAFDVDKNGTGGVADSPSELKFSG